MPDGWELIKVLWKHMLAIWEMCYCAAREKFHIVYLIELHFSKIEKMMGKSEEYNMAEYQDKFIGKSEIYDNGGSEVWR